MSINSYLVKLGLVLLAGALLALAFAPFYIWPVAPCSFYVLILVSRLLSNHLYRRMVACFVFAFGFFTAGLWWLANSLNVAGDQFGWLYPFVILGMPAVFAMPYSLVGMAFHYATVRYQYLIVATTWCLLDLLRSTIYPWNLMGDIALSSISFAQLASLVGIYGLTFLVLLLSVLPASHNWRAISMGVIILVGGCFWGDHRLQHATFEALPTPIVTIIQPNFKHHMGHIDQQQAWLKGMLMATRQHQQGEQTQYIIWPEGAFPFLMRNSSPWFKTLGKSLYRDNKLVFGYDRLASDSAASVPILHNSITVIDGQGSVLGEYDKNILVPFGEYLPFRWGLSYLIEKVAYGVYDFSVGSHTNLLNLGGLQALPLVCYEVIFSRHLRNFDLGKAAFVLNLTNDSWLGDSPGPYQHLAQARMRAIEYGIPVIRAAGSGISAIIDGHGRVIRKTDLNAYAVLNGSIPLKLQEMTIYYKLSNLLLIMVALLSVIVTISKCKMPGRKF